MVKLGIVYTKSTNAPRSSDVGIIEALIVVEVIFLTRCLHLQIQVSELSYGEAKRQNAAHVASRAAKHNETMVYRP